MIFLNMGCRFPWDFAKFAKKLIVMEIVVAKASSFDELACQFVWENDN